MPAYGGNIQTCTCIAVSVSSFEPVYTALAGTQGAIGKKIVVSLFKLNTIHDSKITYKY
jgi:hypothetical protein